MRREGEHQKSDRHRVEVEVATELHEWQPHALYTRLMHGMAQLSRVLLEQAVWITLCGARAGARLQLNGTVSRFSAGRARVLPQNQVQATQLGAQMSQSVESL